MKYTTNELIGWRLDQAVAKACGYGYDTSKSSMVVFEIATNISTLEEGCTIFRDGGFLHYSPSTNWVHGGPIIERERIGILPATKEIKADRAYLRRTGRHFMPECDGWVAGYEPITHIEFDWGGGWEVGPTPLVAAMRVFVAAKYGAEVDL